MMTSSRTTLSLYIRSLSLSIYPTICLCIYLLCLHPVPLIPILMQLLDEMMDNGFPLTTEPNVLKDIVAPPNLVTKVLTAVTGKASPAVSPTLPEAAASCVPWRTAHPKNTTNEVYVNLVEQLDAYVNRSIFFSFFRPLLSSNLF